MGKSHLGELEADLNLRIQQAALALARPSGADHQWHRDGRSTGGLTYGEGQLIVLSKVRRLLRSQHSLSSLELTDYLQSEQAKWQAMVAVDPRDEGSARTMGDRLWPRWAGCTCNTPAYIRGNPFGN